MNVINTMKLVVIGGTGLIGSKLVTKLREHGHEAVAASPATGFFTASTRNLLEAEAGAGVTHHVALSVVGTVRLPHTQELPAVRSELNTIQELRT